jgi:hypothetical protein
MQLIEHSYSSVDVSDFGIVNDQNIIHIAKISLGLLIIKDMENAMNSRY